MKKLEKNYTALKAQFVLIILFLVVSCGPKKYTEIPLDQLEGKLKSRGDMIVKDIIASLNDEKGARYLLGKKYTTPLVHARIVQNTEMYKESYMMGSTVVGNVSDYKLFQVVNKNVVKTMRYKLITDSKTMKFVELKIDINEEYNLADFYLYLTSNDGQLKRQNIMPAKVK